LVVKTALVLIKLVNVALSEIENVTAPASWTARWSNAPSIKPQKHATGLKDNGRVLSVDINSPLDFINPPGDTPP
jgi:hypothetical protein